MILGNAGNQPGTRGLSRRVRLSWLMLAGERAARAFWPFWSGALLALALGLSGLLPHLGPWPHTVLLVLTGVGLAGLLVHGVRMFRMPSWRKARLRLDEGHAGRPASVVADRQRIGRGDLFAEGAWRIHRERAAREASGLRVRLANFELAGLDRFALRAAALLLFGAAAVSAGASWQARLDAALTPGALGLGAGPGTPPRIEAWLQPPAYTGVAPVFLTESGLGEAPIALPENTRFEARVYGAGRVPALLETPLDAARTPIGKQFEREGEGTYAVALELKDDVRLTVEAEMGVTGAWTITMVPDIPPTIEFTAPPQATRTHATALAYRVADDYGAARAWAVIGLAALDPESVPLARLEPIEIPLALPFVRLDESEEFVIRDLTAHPWAGSEVEATLFVEDESGQVGRSDTRAFQLPERDFTEPMAAAFVEQRRNLALASDLGELFRVRRAVGAALHRPEEYFSEYLPFTAASLAMARLDRVIGDGPAEGDIESSSELLWRAALRLQEGRLADTAEDLREAMNALEEALARGADDAEIASLMRALRRALAERVDALRESAAPELAGDFSNEMQIGDDLLGTMLGSLEGASRMGQREQARNLLSQLRRMLENMRARTESDGQRGLGELVSIAREQVRVADETQRSGQESGEGADLPEGILDSEALEALQEELRSRLETLMDAVDAMAVPGDGESGEGEGEALGSLGQAGEEMDQALAALRDGNPSEAVPSQLAAVESLRSAIREQWRERGQRVVAGGRSGNGTGLERPGWNFGQSYADGDLQIPRFDGVIRARELFEEIRRRSGDRRRPPGERDYLERLIDRF